MTNILDLKFNMARNIFQNIIKTYENKVSMHFRDGIDSMSILVNGRVFIGYDKHGLVLVNISTHNCINFFNSNIYDIYRIFKIVYNYKLDNRVSCELSKFIPMGLYIPKKIYISDSFSISDFFEKLSKIYMLKNIENIGQYGIYTSNLYQINFFNMSGELINIKVFFEPIDTINESETWIINYHLQSLCELIGMMKK